MSRRPMALGLAALALAAASVSLAAPSEVSPVLLGKPGARIAGQAFAAPGLSAHPRLVVILHGDSPDGPPSYQYVFAHRLADSAPDTVALALLRPGYSDPAGRKSEGKHGLTTGDNYTPEVLAALIDAIEEARRKYAAREVVLVGHSGGAVLAADIMGERPALASRAILASCPCDVKRWRLQMAGRQLTPAWLLPVQSISPMDRIAGLSPKARLDLVVGSADPTAPAALSQAYAAAARKQGAAVSLTVLPNLGHEILLEPQVVALAGRP